MTPRQIDLIRNSFSAIAPAASSIAETFYVRLFEMQPSLRRLFSSDLDVQGARLVRALGAAIERLEQRDALLPMLHELGRRHVAYGVLARDYDTAGAALLSALDLHLGAAFDAEMRAAWAQAYGEVAAAMQAGAEAADAAA